MLHKIRIPETCRPYFEWIVELQRRLLTAICQATPDEIETEWIIAQLSDLDAKWVRTFCGRKDNISGVKRSMIDHMCTIASLPVDVKTKLIEEFDRDREFQKAFEGDTSHTYLSKLTILEAEDSRIRQAVRGFFESFYDPNFYPKQGYQILQVSGRLVRFDRDIFVGKFKAANQGEAVRPLADLEVCPMCDGNLGKPEVDHFYPKAHYPHLSCHYLNLVPICSNCNSRSYKGEKSPLTPKPDPPTVDWFHPYLRSAHDDTFEVQFERHNGRHVPVLFNSHSQIQKRIDNLNKLIKLEERWRQALSGIVKATIGDIRRVFRRRRKILGKEELCEQLQEWADSASEGFRLIPHAIVKRYYLQSAADGQPHTFDELWISATDTDTLG
ncbi:MAG: HNH endonuclease signature motif containing protein [Candidatus Poribacteria bacterium]|nr:HNH endonuclease signature motif containing protein [Candidatus Poribacteria bacterium]